MMAYHKSIFTPSILLFALVAIASATDYQYGPIPKIEKSKFKIELDNKTYSTKSDYENYEYGPAPKSEKPKQETIYVSDYEDPKSKTYYEYDPTTKFEKLKPKFVYKPNTTNLDYELPKPKTNYGYPPTQKIEKSKVKTYYKIPSTKLDYEVPKPKESYKVQQPTVIGVQGVVLCKSGSNYYPIQGAVVQVTCGLINKLGYETNHISTLSHGTDNKGHYFATLSLAKMGSKLKINECKVYLKSSPLELCKVPTDVNHGISGFPLSSYSLIENNFKLYSVAPFFYTSQSKSVPNGY